jgi:hypothetical protein
LATASGFNMASEQSPFKRAVINLPVIGQYHEDTQSRRAQNTWFGTQNLDGFMEQEPTVLEYIKSIIPKKHGILQYVEDTFPCSKWLFNYNLQWFLGDVIAGVTVGAVVIPQVSLVKYVDGSRLT